MSTFAVTFDIKFDTATNWNRRYDSLMAAINKCKRVWKETTSFCLVETTETLDDFERRLFLTDFDGSQDKMLVIDVGYDSCISRGAIKDKALLRALMPMVQSK